MGRQFAMVQMGYTIGRVLQHFERVVNVGQRDQEILKSEVILTPADGIRVAFVRARDIEQL